MNKRVVSFIFASIFSVPLWATPVNINSADAQTLANALKGTGIGLKKAQAIVDYRTKNGEFKTLEDVDKVSGIGIKTLEKMKADILFTDAPSASSVKEVPQNPKPTEAPAAVKGSDLPAAKPAQVPPAVAPKAPAH